MLITNKQLLDKILDELIEADKEFSPTVLHPILIGAFIRVLKENLPDEDVKPYKCSKCNYWKRETSNGIKFDYGKCTGIDIDIEIDGGWSGGVVKHIETDEKFYCGSFNNEKQTKK